MNNKLCIAVSAAVALGFSAAAQNIPNPLLRNVADIGVMNYNGKYYLGGCRTDGDFYISSDLINWEGPVHVIDMNNDWSRNSGCGNNQIHANDMLYDNGTVHAYWSVNYWGNDLHAVHVVHSEADNPMGPYAEPVKDRWMDNRIDPKVFRDDDGKLYMYMVRFTDGNTIWARKMKNWREFEEGDGSILCQFSSNPNTWERMDNAVAEGPWVMKYHNKYYMMYNANHTGGEWGNYQLGVAVADSPMGFNNGNKYPHPVVLSNQKELEDNNVDLLRFYKGAFTPDFRYSTSAVDGDWYRPEFDDSSWAAGAGGFAPGSERGSTTYRCLTKWNTDTIRLRKTFHIDNLSDNLALRLTSKGPSTVYINGKKIADYDKGVYKIVNLTPEMKKALQTGDNVIAVESSKGHRHQAYINAELFDTGNTGAAPEIVWTPGQPNILRGPNGLEWWLIYMANDNALSRSQYADRVHFYGDKLTVDGITHRNNPGYHPLPALPAYGDVFDNEAGKSKWESLSGFRIADGELAASEPAEAHLAPALSAGSYLWEVNVKPQKSAGVYAIRLDKDNNVAILFDKDNGTWTVTETKNGARNTLTSVPLRADFRWDAYHNIRVERDVRDLVVSIDGMRHPDIIECSFPDDAVPGIAAAAGSAFDGVIYTVGFDDGNDRMNGWNLSAGTMIPTDKGAVAKGSLNAFKGNPAKSYEFATQISGLADDAVAGFYPLYVDKDNYIKVTVDAPKQCLNITEVRKGKAVDKAVPLDTVRTLYTDARFTDSYEKTYTTDCPTVFDAIYLKRYDIANRNIFTESRFDGPKNGASAREIFVDNMFDIVVPSVVDGDGTRHRIDTSAAAVDTNPAYNVVRTAPVRTSRLVFNNTKPTDGGFHIYDIRIHELFKDSYNLRANRDGDTLRIFVDGRLMATMPVKGYKDSSIGLVAEAGTPEYHGLIYYRK